MSLTTNPEERPTRLIIADDHPLFRSALRYVFDGCPDDFTVVGEATDGREALELCRRLRPELVMMDVRMPRMDGLAATRAIKQEFPHIAVLILTTFEDPNYLFEAIKVGAGGYILKSATSEEIIDAVRGVLSGEAPLSRELSALLLRRLIAEMQERPQEDVATPRRAAEEYPLPALAKPLAPRETQVLRLVVRGQTNPEIARNLLISTSSVKKYLHRAIEKLGVSDRVQAAVRAVELDLLFEEQERN